MREENELKTLSPLSEDESVEMYRAVDDHGARVLGFEDIERLLVTVASLRAQLAAEKARADALVSHIATMPDQADYSAALSDHAETLRLVRKLVDSLPKCSSPGHEDVPATKAWGRGGVRYCDDCSAAVWSVYLNHIAMGVVVDRNEPPPDFPSAAPLRALLARLK